jgi:hypothetical protein
MLWLANILALSVIRWRVWALSVPDEGYELWAYQMKGMSLERTRWRVWALSVTRWRVWALSVTRWRVFQKHVVGTTFDIYVFITHFFYLAVQSMHHHLCTFNTVCVYVLSIFLYKDIVKYQQEDEIYEAVRTMYICDGSIEWLSSTLYLRIKTIDLQWLEYEIWLLNLIMIQQSGIWTIIITGPRSYHVKNRNSI